MREPNLHDTYARPVARRAVLSVLASTPLLWSRSTPKRAVRAPSFPLAASPGPTTVIGLYSWAWEARSYIAQIDQTKFQILRMGGDLDPESMDTLTTHGKRIVKVISPDRSRSACISDDEFVAAYIARIDAFMSQYGPRGSYFSSSTTRAGRSPVMELEITNEPNFDPQLGPDLASRSSLYAKMLVASYAHIKTTWPNVTVVGFGAGGRSAAAPGFIQRVHQADARVATSYDVLSFHPYIEPTPPEATRTEAWGQWNIEGTIIAIRQIMQTYSTAVKPLWVTEIGWQIAQSAGGKYANKAGLSSSLQAAYSLRANVLFTRLGVARVYHMFTTDTDNFNGGFYASTSTPRPIAVATQTYITLCRGAARRVETLADGAMSGYWAYLITAWDGSAFIAAWADSPKSASLPPPNPATTTTTLDMLGNASGMAGAGKAVSVTLGPTPTFLVSSHGVA